MGPTASHAALEERKTIAYSAAAIFIGAILVIGIETLLPGGPTRSVVPGIAALVMAPIAIFAGPHLPRAALAVFAPIGVALIAYALAATEGGPTDAAVLYMWPVLWMAYFYGRLGAAFIVLWVALAQGVALVAMPADMVSIDRWIDVVASVTVVALVVHYLASRNARLVTDLKKQARVDPITGLLNRRGLDERMEVEVARALRQDTPMAVATLNIDRFKSINDVHGHELGDRALNWIGSVVAQQTRGVDVAARIGGDEFLVLMSDADADAGARLGERVRDGIANPPDMPNRRSLGLPDDLELTVSVGVAAATAREAHDLMEAADRALYVAKEEGRNRVVATDFGELRSALA